MGKDSPFTYFYIVDSKDKRISLAIVQYTFFDGVEVPIKMAPHGNSIKNKRPFFRTQASTMDSIKKDVSSMCSKEILSNSYKDAGGLLNIKSSGEVPRNRRQVYNAKSYQGCTSGLTSNTDKDLVYDLLEQHYTSEKDFVRNVNFDEGVMSVVGTDKQFNDVERFCACDDPVCGAILGLDPTFNLGDFYVTPTVYQHKLLKNRVTENHPIFIGPTLIHQDRKYGTYHYFASQLKKIQRKLDGLIAFGTDGEEAISSAFQSVFPRSVHLLCSIHKRDNITRKLREMNATEGGVKQIVADIFGSKIEDKEFPGLIDSKDRIDFNENLERIKSKWEHICPGFLEWFVKHEAEMMCTSMIASVRTVAGLGKPPKLFTTNNCESS